MMTLRTRRYAAAGAVVIALLLAGRWTAVFVAERWWGASLSPSIASFVSGWQLLGVALDLGAILLASAWFVIHALLVARAIALVQVAHRFGDLLLRETIPTRVLLGGAVAAGVLLGLIAGAGAHAWREPVMLGWQGVRYGVRDPILNRDLGLYVAQLPAWDLGHRFLALLGVLGLGFCVALYSGIGALRRDRWAVTIHPDARRHLGSLLAFIAGVIALGYLLKPYHIVADADASATAAGAILRIHGAQVMVGVAIATALLTLVWVFRGRQRVLLAGWCVLAVGALAERFMLPVFADTSPADAAARTAAQRVDSLAWGIHLAPSPSSGDSVVQATGIWDEGMLGVLAARGGSTVEAVTPTILPGTPARAGWLVAMSAPNEPAQHDILAVVDDTAAADGSPVLLRSAAAGRGARAWISVQNPRTGPLAADWRTVTTGVNAGSPLRRLLLAWARQAPSMLRDPSSGAFDWHLNPVDRAVTVLPMFTWLPADLVLVNGQPTWLVQGMCAVNRLPLASRWRWEGEQVAGVVPGVIGTIDVSSGETHFYLDPAADSLAAAWARIVGSVIAPAASIPADVRASETYPAAWLDAQLAVLAGPVWNDGRQLARSGIGRGSAPVWALGRHAARQAVLAEGDHDIVASVVTAFRSDGLPEIVISHHQADGTVAASPSDLRRVWNRTPDVGHLRDSVTAAGDTVLWRAMRWRIRAGDLEAWQPMFALPRRSGPSLLWVASAIGNETGGGRLPSDAWRSAANPAASTPRGPGDAQIVEQARQWVQRADSAFRRGDLTAFGRAFEELRRVLQRPLPTINH